MRNYRLIFGISFWCIALVGALMVPVFLSGNSWISSIPRVFRYVHSERQTVTVNFNRDLYVQYGDPVFLKTEYGFKRIGQVTSEQVNEFGIEVRTKSVKIILFGDAPPITHDCFVTLHDTPSSFEWAVNKLLPKQKREEIINELKLKFKEHQAEIIEGFTPIVQDTIFEMGKVLQEDLRNAIRDNREQLIKIGARYQESFVEKKLIPLVKKEIWPIIERRSTPVINRVGNEIWQKASLWRFGWRLAYDKFPLTNSNLLEQEWNRFVKNDAIPVIENHADEFYQLARSIMREISENTEVKQAGKEGIQQLLKDEEIKELITKTLWKILFENDRLNEVVKRNLSSERTVTLIRETSDKFEDKIREIGDELFGTFEQGIKKEFAAVLRKEILQRDQRWFELKYAGTADENRLEIATQIDGFFDPDASDRPEFVRYWNDK